MPALSRMERRHVARCTTLPLVIVDCAAYADGKRITGTLAIEEVGPYLTRPDAFVWLGLRMPSPEELRAACAVFGLGALDVDAVLAPHRRAVLGQQAGVAWLVLRTSTYDDHEEVVHLGEISVLACQRFLITIRHGHAAALSSARKELEADRERLRGGVPAALVAVISAVVESYGPALDGFEKDAVEVEREVLSEARIRPLRRLLNLKRQVRELQLVVDALEDPLERLSRRREFVWSAGHARRAARDPRRRAPRVAAHPIAERPGRRRPHRQPRPGLQAAERRHAQDLGVGRDRGGADGDRRHLRHELRPHAGAALGRRLPDRPQP